MRVSGKHNDLEQVGLSPRHHTFFEMLGNFSFGGYFKREAIQFAWELLTREYRLPVERLWISVHESDDGAVRIWEDVGVDRGRILCFGDDENFWSMGDTGPCGPCSEIHYYRGKDVAHQRPEGVNSEDDYMEIWNLVFMQYNRELDGTLTPLPMPMVDTGMGFERIVSVLQGVNTNYETDLFQPLIKHILVVLGADNEKYHAHMAVYKAIADHSRALAFLLAEGIQPGNNEHSYVVRRILRRASYLGRTVGHDTPFLADVVPMVIEMMGEAYPELREHEQQILLWTTQEEQRFRRTLSSGLRHLDAVIQSMRQEQRQILSGREAFKLHDTYGFPLDLTSKILTDSGFAVNVEEYDEERRIQQQRSRSGARSR
jgi:alanyl-tRNA synthetase